MAEIAGGSEVLVVQNINVEYILNLDTTIKVGDGGGMFHDWRNKEYPGDSCR